MTGRLADEAPVAAAIPRLVHAAIAADDEVISIVRVDPDRVIVDVFLLLTHAAERASAVFGHLQDDVNGVNAIDVMRIGEDLVVVVPASLVASPSSPSSRRRSRERKNPPRPCAASAIA